MKMRFLGVSTVAAAVLAFTPATAATVVFDDFDLVQSTTDMPAVGSTQVNTSMVPFGAGSRTLTATNITNNGISENATTLQVAGGSLSFSNNDGATGTGELSYSDVGDIQLDDDPSRSFFSFGIDPGAFDQIAQFTVTATDTNAMTSTYTETLLPGFDTQLFFSEFTGSADFNILSTLSFLIDSHNVLSGFGPQPKLDGSLNSISIGAVPLPASGLLLFGALGGVVALRRRKARKAA